MCFNFKPQTPWNQDFRCIFWGLIENTKSASSTCDFCSLMGTFFWENILQAFATYFHGNKLVTFRCATHTMRTLKFFHFHFLHQMFVNVACWKHSIFFEICLGIHLAFLHGKKFSKVAAFIERSMCSARYRWERFFGITLAMHHKMDVDGAQSFDFFNECFYCFLFSCRNVQMILNGTCKSGHVQ